MTDVGLKAKYFADTLAKLNHKKWELYVVSRVIHLLNDMEIEFVCQQLILLQDGSWVFADMYFPQFNLCLEINERGGHAKLADRLRDEKRKLEILKSVGARVEKIENFIEINGTISDTSLARLNNQIDQFVKQLRQQKFKALKANSFIPWDITDQYSPQRHIERKYLDANENPSFRYITDVLKCFGYDKGTYQKAAWRDPSWSKSIVWTPSFLAHPLWQNKLLEDEETITETLKDLSKLNKHSKKTTHPIRYTFAKTRSPFGDTLYRFLGEFHLKSELKGENILTRSYVLYRHRISIPNPEQTS